MKPGFQTTEFLAYGAVVGLIYDAGLLTDPTPIVRAVTVLSLVGGWCCYGYCRTRTKTQTPGGTQ